MDFENKLKSAIERGAQKSAQKKESDKKAQLSKEEIRNRHNEFRIHLSDHIEVCLKKLLNHFPGFNYETLYGDKGWGGAISRDDLTLGRDGRGGEFFSRLEVSVLPLNEFNVINIAGKGTVKNKEVARWNHFKDVETATIDEFQEKIDQWILSYAEQFAAN